MGVKGMNKKILGILICMLFIAVGSIPVNSTNTFANTPPTFTECRYDWHNYTLVVSATDDEKDTIRYGIILYHENDVFKWTDYYNSGVTVAIDVKGLKETVTVLAEDIYGAQAELTGVMLSKGKSIGLPIFNSYFEKLFEHFPLFVKIINKYFN